MDPKFTVIRDQTPQLIERYSEITGRGLIASLKRFAKGVARRLVHEITPPAHGSVKGAAAYRTGRKRISSDMARVLAPRRLKGKRKITHVFGRRLARPVYAKTKEKHPDVHAAYRRVARFRNKGSGVKTGRVRQVMFVDRTKYKALEKRLHGNVGRLASGWVSAAAAMGQSVQAWIARHGRSRGAVRQNFATGGRLMVEMTNRLPANLPGHVRHELERRVVYAVQYQRNAMKREMEYIALRAGQQAGMKVRRMPMVPAGMYGGDRAA